MILYLTKETFERYHLKTPQEMQNELPKKIAENVLEKESGDSLQEWGGKLFYFDRRKCLLLIHFSSLFTIVLVDFKVSDLPNLGDVVAHYLFKIYEDDVQMKRALEHYYAAHPALAFSRLKNRKISSKLSFKQRTMLEDGYLLADYIWDGILHTVELNQYLCDSEVVMEKADGEKKYYGSKEFFAIKMKERFL